MNHQTHTSRKIGQYLVTKEIRRLNRCCGDSVCEWCAPEMPAFIHLRPACRPCKFYETGLSLERIISLSKKECKGCITVSKL